MKCLKFTAYSSDPVMEIRSTGSGGNRLLFYLNFFSLQKKNGLSWLE
jgi:hypothetical protein